jgi:hypothetical protein
MGGISADPARVACVLSIARRNGHDLGMTAEGYRCWCCGQPVLREEPRGTYEICANCGWEDDPVQLQDPDYAGGANGLSIRQHRRQLFEDAAVKAYWRTGNQHGRPQIVVRIPDWDDVSLDEGATWFDSRIENGWYVDYRACPDGTRVIIWMKYWEYGDSEPGFPRVSAPNRASAKVPYPGASAEPLCQTDGCGALDRLARRVVTGFGRQDVAVERRASRPALVVVAGTATAGFGLFGAATGAGQTVTYVLTVVLLGVGVVRLDRTVRFSDLVAVGLTGWAVAHLAGGLIGLDGDRVLYNAGLAPHLRYDNVVHFIGFGVAGVAVWETLASRLMRPDPPPLAAGITVWLFGMGIGALNEVVEFAIALNVEESNVGGYLNTGRDLVANLLGAAVAGAVVARRVRSPATQAKTTRRGVSGADAAEQV